ncbi:nuclear transport factor 2 family protein [Pseudonocardia xishanensis]|uniref:Nuclear transport factor 2 family protein n=1 Tax=Pseudonocardia xishanensis TaxID=630995 RepID=A0ABP8RYR0_9PSEU
MDATTEHELRQMLDRQQILDCIHRYTRGIDRFDRELMLSAYHEDAFDDHGVFQGNPEEFADWVYDMHRRRHTLHQHYVTNHTCQLAGDTAHTETYFLLLAHNTSGSPISMHGGRYLDRFERRGGRWAIAARAVTSEWTGEVPTIQGAQLPRTAPGAVLRGPGDVSYARPLNRQTAAATLENR